MLSWLRNIKVRQKLTLGFSIVLLLMLVIGIVGLNGVKNIDECVDDIFYSRIPSMDFLIEADRDFQQLLVAERSMVFTNTNSEDFKKLLNDYIENLQQAEDRFAKYEKLAATEQEKKIIKDFYLALEEWKKVSQQIVDGRVEDTRAGRRLALDLSLTEAATKFEAMRDYIDQLTQINLELADKDHEEAEKISRASTFVITFVMISSVIFAIGIVLVITILITRPLLTIKNTASALSKGDIARETKIHQRDEIGDLAVSFRELSDSLNNKTKAAQSIANGNLDIHLDIQSEKDILGNAMLQMTEKIKAMITAVDELADSAIHGILDKRADKSQFSGDFEKIIVGVNGTLDSVVAPVNQVLMVLERIAQKDLTAKMTGDYEGTFQKMKQALNTAVSNLNEGFEQVASAANQLNSASSQISKGSQTIAQSSSEQASSLEEISSNVEEVSSMTRENSKGAKNAAEIADKANNSTVRGIESMDELSGVMDQIKTSADETAKIVKTIDEIAFQTNLLALNAAVEAARAGESGKGFSVVAEEVRNLAMRSAEAARTTSSLIQQSVQNAESGVLVNQTVEKNLNDIKLHVESVNEVVKSISEASDQQTEGLDQVNQAISQLSNTVQHNAANAEEFAGTSEQLSAQSYELNGLVDTFILE